MYSNYVRMEGLEVIKLYLNYFGYSAFKDKSGKDYHRYTEFHGSIQWRKEIEIKNISMYQKIKMVK